ncbi:MAG: YlmH/Sll1252 family protein [Defluviitaleaceae bacterium]|nr:YlmH/Sll1252 family protein [Defluviitaleaceae bacterium]
MTAINVLLAHANDLAKKAARSGFAASKFLTPAEAESIKFSRNRDADLVFDGGFDDAERTRAIFINPDWGSYEREEIFAAIKISHRPQDTLGHRDILGALTALGIERETIGDIIVGDNAASFVCLPEISKYIIENFFQAGRVGVSSEIITLDELPVREENLTLKTDTVASLRLDAVMCAAFKLSRTKAGELISAGRVSLRHQICLRPDKDVSENAVISVRGLGRAKLLEIGGTSKKGRTFIKIGLYGR